jgi:serine/threonine protein kinase
MCHCLADGLIEIRSKKISHRDIKPLNILINIEKNGERVYKIADFGGSKIYDNDILKTWHGTLTHMHPKIIKNMVYNKDTENYTTSCDLWSLGITLYQSLTDKLAFTQELFDANPHDHDRRQYDE